MTWREFADAAGAKVIGRGIARGSFKKIQPKIMKKLQLRIVLAVARPNRRRWFRTHSK
jgi:hypothetical protein